MSNSKKLKTLASSVQDYMWTLAAVWTMMVAISLAWNVVNQRKATLEAARAEARAIHMKDILYRRWTALHGGVYVPVTEAIRPNPFLAHLPERDVTTLSGLRLTLINPAYMTRLVSDLQEHDSGVRAHITILKPLRPGNAADPWEIEALRAFESGEKEVSSMVELDGEAYMRLMRPLVTEEPCLKCHAAQGYQVGAIRGGISVSVAMRPLLTIARRYTFTMSLGHAMLWIMGLLGISIQSWQIKRRVTERDRAEESLRTSEEKYRLLTETADEGIYILGPAGFEYVNPAFQRITGYPAEKLLRKDFDFMDLIHPDDKDLILARTKARDEGRKVPSKYEFRFVRRDKEVRDLDISTVELPGEPWMVMGIFRDITERKRVEEHLIESEQQLRSLAAHLTSSREETMIAISRDLHDELGQILTGLKMDAAWLHGKILNEQQPLKEKVESIVGDLNDTIQVVKRITAQLRPVILDNQGLVPALRYEVQEFKKRTGIECNITIEPPEPTTDKDYSTVIYRILQESLTNIKKHARASKVVISLKAGQKQLVLRVQDDGIGITKEQMEKTGSYGLLGMRERVLHLDGEIKIQGTQGQGTQLNVTIPVKRKD